MENKQKEIRYYSPSSLKLRHVRVNMLSKTTNIDVVLFMLSI
jgi:hypothetical protein